MVAVTQAGLRGVQAVNQFSMSARRLASSKTIAAHKDSNGIAKHDRSKAAAIPTTSWYWSKSWKAPTPLTGPDSGGPGKDWREARLAIPALLNQLRDEQNETTSGVMADALAKSAARKARRGLVAQGRQGLEPQGAAYAATSIGAIGPDAGSLLTLADRGGQGQSGRPAKRRKFPRKNGRQWQRCRSARSHECRERFRTRSARGSRDVVREHGRPGRCRRGPINELAEHQHFEVRRRRPVHWRKWDPGPRPRCRH